MPAVIETEECPRIFAQVEGVHARLKTQRRKGMSQSMQRQLREPRRLHLAGEAARDVPGGERPADLIGEDSVIVRVGRTRDQPLLGLSDPVPPQRSHRGGVQRHGAPRARSLRLLLGDHGAVLHEGAADSHDRGSGIKVEVSPAQAQQLPAAGTGRGRQDVQRPEPLFPDELQETAHLGGRPYPHVGITLHAGTFTDVAGFQSSRRASTASLRALRKVVWMLRTETGDNARPPGPPVASSSA